MMRRRAIRNSALLGRLAPVCPTDNASGKSQLSDGDLGDSTNTDSKILSNKNGIHQNVLDVQGVGKCTLAERWMKHVNSEKTVKRNVLFSYVQKGISLVPPHRQLSREMQSRGGARISMYYNNVQSIMLYQS